MFFQFGALFLLGSLSVSSALPPCMCPKILRPVCGSDGQTYDNECRLICAQVTRNPELFLEKTGTCDGTSVFSPTDFRHKQNCRFCTLEYMPMCGTDGITYPNRCALYCAHGPRPIRLAYAGTCINKRETVRVPELNSVDKAGPYEE